MSGSIFSDLEAGMHLNQEARFYFAESTVVNGRTSTTIPSLAGHITRGRIRVASNRERMIAGQDQALITHVGLFPRFQGARQPQRGDHVTVEDPDRTGDSLHTYRVLAPMLGSETAFITLALESVEHV